MHIAMSTIGDPGIKLQERQQKIHAHRTPKVHLFRGV
jgi:hypothetical protein